MASDKTSNRQNQQQTSRESSDKPQGFAPANETLWQFLARNPGAEVIGVREEGSEQAQGTLQEWLDRHPPGTKYRLVYDRPEDQKPDQKPGSAPVDPEADPADR